MAVLLLTVPWFFTGEEQHVIAGLPVWALYTILATAAYAVIVAYMLKRFWRLMAGSDGEDS